MPDMFQHQNRAGAFWDSSFMITHRQFAFASPFTWSIYKWLSALKANWLMQWAVTPRAKQRLPNVWALPRQRAGTWNNIPGFSDAVCLEQLQKDLECEKARNVRWPALFCKSKSWRTVLHADIAYDCKRSNILRGPENIDGVQHETFKAACVARGIYENDDEWEQCLREAEVWQSGAKLRPLFVTVLFHGGPAEPRRLWMNFQDP